MDNTTLTFKQRFKPSRFFKGELPISGPVELTHRRIFILPTQRGLGMVFTMVLLLLVAFIYNNSLVYLLYFFWRVYFLSLFYMHSNHWQGLWCRLDPCSRCLPGKLPGLRRR